MKKSKLIASALLIALTVFFAGCATPFPVGAAFTDVELPIMATSNSASSSTKKGVATCESYLCLFAVGEASIQKAAENGDIKKITHIDWDAKNILGVYGVYTVTVYGE